MSTPIALYRGIVRYIEAAQRADPVGSADLIENQSKHLQESLVAIPLSREHGTEVLEALSEPSCPFSSEQRKQVTGVVTGLLKGSAASSPGGKKLAVLQEHLHLEHYLPDDLWSFFMDKEKPFDSKLNVMAEFMVVNLGCPNPTAPTKVRAVGILHLASGIAPSPDISYAHFREFGVAVGIKRTTTNVDQTYAKFPKNPQEPSLFLSPSLSLSLSLSFS